MIKKIAIIIFIILTEYLLIYWSCSPSGLIPMDILPFLPFVFLILLILFLRNLKNSLTSFQEKIRFFGLIIISGVFIFFGGGQFISFSQNMMLDKYGKQSIAKILSIEEKAYRGRHSVTVEFEAESTKIATNCYFLGHQIPKRDTISIIYLPYNTEVFKFLGNDQELFIK